MDANMLRGAKMAEDMLDREKGGELAALPEGHPLRRAIEDARRRHEEQLALEQQVQQEEEARKKRRGRRKRKKQVAAKKREAHDEFLRRRNAASQLNKGLDKLAQNTVELMGSLSDYEEALAGLPGLSNRMVRLRRMAAAFHRGLMDSKLNLSRIPEED